MILNRKVISNLIFFILLALVFFTPVGEKLKTFLHGLAISEPTVEKVTGTKSQWENQEYQLALKGINTDNAHLSETKGKVLLLNIWGSWCLRCRAEMPSLQALYDEKGADVEMVFLSMQDKEENLRKYIDDNGLTLPIYTANSLIPQSLKPKEFPTTYIIDKKGKVALFKAGVAEWNSPNIKNLLDSLVVN